MWYHRSLRFKCQQLITKIKFISQTEISLTVSNQWRFMIIYAPRGPSLSVLSKMALNLPILIMYITIIADVIRHGTPFMLADDIHVVYAFYPVSLSSAISKISDNLSALSRWRTKGLRKRPVDLNAHYPFSSRHPRKISSWCDISISFRPNSTNVTTFL